MAHALIEKAQALWVSRKANKDHLEKLCQSAIQQLEKLQARRKPNRKASKKHKMEDDPALTSKKLKMDTLEDDLALAYVWLYITQDRDPVEVEAKFRGKEAKPPDLPESPTSDSEVLETSDTCATVMAEHASLEPLLLALDLWESSLCGEKGAGSLRTPHVTVVTLSMVAAIFRLSNKVVHTHRALQMAAQLARATKNHHQFLLAEVQLALSFVQLKQPHYAEVVIECAEDWLVSNKLDKVKKTTTYIQLMVGKGETWLLKNEVAKSRQVLEEAKQLQSASFKCKSLDWMMVEGPIKALEARLAALPLDSRNSLPPSETSLDLLGKGVRSTSGVMCYLLGNWMFGTAEEDAKTPDNTAEKWTVLDHMLSLLMETGSLYVGIGEQREAKCYLLQGIKLAQAFHLPRRFAEFHLQLGRLNLLAAKYTDCEAHLHRTQFVISCAAKPSTDSRESNSRPPYKARLKFFGFDSSIEEASQSDSDEEFTLKSKPIRVSDGLLHDGDASGSPKVTPKASMELPSQWDHDKNCNCEHCIDLSLQAVILRQVMTQAKMHALQNETVNADQIYDALLRKFSTVSARTHSHVEDIAVRALKVSTGRPPEGVGSAPSLFQGMLVEVCIELCMLALQKGDPAQFQVWMAKAQDLLDVEKYPWMAGSDCHLAHITYLQAITFLPSSAPRARSGPTPDQLITKLSQLTVAEKAAEDGDDNWDFKTPLAAGKSRVAQSRTSKHVSALTYRRDAKGKKNPGRPTVSFSASGKKSASSLKEPSVSKKSASTSSQSPVIMNLSIPDDTAHGLSREATPQMGKLAKKPTIKMAQIVSIPTTPTTATIRKPKHMAMFQELLDSEMSDQTLDVDSECDPLKENCEPNTHRARKSRNCAKLPRKDSQVRLNSPPKMNKESIFDFSESDLDAVSHANHTKKHVMSKTSRKTANKGAKDQPKAPKVRVNGVAAKRTVQSTRSTRSKTTMEKPREEASGENAIQVNLETSMCEETSLLSEEEFAIESEAALDSSIEFPRGDVDPNAKSTNLRARKPRQSKKTEPSANAELEAELPRRSAMRRDKTHPGPLTPQPGRVSESRSKSVFGDPADQTRARQQLLKAFGLIYRNPPLVLYRNICQSLALISLESGRPWETAYYLGEAQGVTLRHSILAHSTKKARKMETGKLEGAEVDGLSSEFQDFDLNCDSKKGRLRDLRSNLSFDKTIQHVKDVVSSLPEEWIVVQMAVTTSLAHPGGQIIVTRMKAGSAPLHLTLPGLSTPQGQQLLAEFDLIMRSSKHTMALTCRLEWWEQRRNLDTKYKEVLDNMESLYLGEWRGVLLGSLFKEHDDQLLSAAVKSLYKTLPLRDGEHYRQLLEMLLGSCHLLSHREVVLALQALLEDCDDGETFAGYLEKIQRQSKLLNLSASNRHPVILILDKSLQHLPWESLSSLQGQPATRVPSLYFLHAHLASHRASEHSVYSTGVDTTKTYYILDPENNLPNTQEVFLDWFKSKLHWKGISGQTPSSAQYVEAVTQHDLFVYCGHGNGSKFLSGDSLQMLEARAAVFLMGCSSGKLLAEGQLEPSGMMLHYFLAGSPCIVANLWDVTDKDIDRFLHKLLETWLSAASGTSLLDCIRHGREACKFPNLVGAAPVVYGLPVLKK